MSEPLLVETDGEIAQLTLSIGRKRATRSTELCAEPSPAHSAICARGRG